MVNPSREEEERTRVIMDAGRARESTKVIVQKNARPLLILFLVSQKPKDLPNMHSPSPAPIINPAVGAMTKALANSLAAEEVKK